MASSNNYECDKHDEVFSHENDLSIEKEGTYANWRLESARNESSNRCRSSSGTKNQRRGIGRNWRTTTGDNHKVLKAIKWHPMILTSWLKPISFKLPLKNCGTLKKKKESYTNQKTPSHRNRDIGIQGNWRNSCQESHRSYMDRNWRINRYEKRDIEERAKSPGCHGGSEHLSFEEAYSENSVHGWWRIRCTLGKEAEDMWDALNELHDENKRLFPIPPRRWKNKNKFSREHQKTYQSENMESFTSTKSDKEQIKAAAEAIRNKIYFSFVMYYFEAPYDYTKRHKYIHTPENEFYEEEKGFWKIAFIDSAAEGSEKSTVPTEISVRKNSKSSGVKSKMHGASRSKDLSACLFPPNEVKLPSQVLNNEYIYFPSTEEAMEKMRGSTSGKWLVYSGTSMVKQDDMWLTLLPLCKEGILIGMKASTAIITDAQQFMDGEVILCYTADANDKTDVKKSVDAIRKVTQKDFIMYYKTNTSSEEGRYRKDGCLSVTSYMSTVNGSFYARDRFKRWMLTKL